MKKVVIALVILSGVFVGGLSQKSEAVPLLDVSVTLSNSRLSFSGGLAAGNTVGSSQVIINTTVGSYPSTSSAQLVNGDVLTIGTGQTMGNYTVTGVPSVNTVNITPVLGAGHADTSDNVISTQSAVTTIRFTTANAIADGAFRVLVPALTNDINAKDGLPDADNFDFGFTPPTVTCPNNIGATYLFVTGTATASAVTIGSQDYHSYECAYSGAGGIGTIFDGGANGSIAISNIINPAPKALHTTGTADTYSVIVQHLNNSYQTIDATTTNIGVIEAVRVTATVSPQITFRINGVGSGISACGGNTDVATSPAAVPLGELSISGFIDAAQALIVSTNAAGGYTVTARASDQLARNNVTCTGDPGGADPFDANCIPDSRGDTTTMSHTVSDEWISTAVKGFAYSLHDVNTSGLTPAFQYTTVGGGCSGTFCARQFADTQDAQVAVQLFSNNTVADNHNLYVCYRAIISATQAAGEYENHIVYTATATF